jgi:hypothetical protein
MMIKLLIIIIIIIRVVVEYYVRGGTYIVHCDEESNAFIFQAFYRYRRQQHAEQNAAACVSLNIVVVLG